MTKRRIMLILLALFTLLMTYSVFSFPFRLPRSAFFTPLVTVAGFAFTLTHASQRMKWPRTLALLGFVFGVSLLFESVGVATGIIYGPYHYTDKLGPLFLGLVPLLIPVAWFMMMYPSYVIADRIVPADWGKWSRLFTVAAVGGIAMTAWDMVMDPIMVAGGHWVWEVNGAYFGIPLQNFLGWWLTAFTTFSLFMLTMGMSKITSEGQYDRLAVLSYVVTGLGNTIAALMGGLCGPALAGILAMTPWVLMGWLKMGEEPTP